MTLPVLGWTALFTTSLFLISPRMPWYQIEYMKPLSIPMISIPSLNFSCSLEVSVLINNENFLGAEIHHTFVDIYYPDWNGNLQHIGDLTEHYDREKWMVNYISNLIQNWNNNTSDSTSLSVHHTSSITALPARKMSRKPYNLLSIKDVNPSTYLNIITDIVQSRGEMTMSLSMLAHVKSLMANKGVVPLTLGLMCENRVNTLMVPAQIMERDCNFEVVALGWVTNVQEKRTKLQMRAIERFQKSGSVLLNTDHNQNMTLEEQLRYFSWQ